MPPRSTPRPLSRPAAKSATKAVPKRGRPLGRFTQNRRFNRLRDALESAPQGLTIQEIADLLRITQRSARRYLDEVKRALDLEAMLITPGGANRWRIKAAERGRAVPLRRTQAFALLSVRDVFDAIKGSALYEEIHVAMEAIHQIALRPGRTAHKGEEKGDGIAAPMPHRFVVTAAPPHQYAAKAEDLDELFGAVAERLAVRFEYRNDENVPHGTTVHPLAMVLHAGALYCIAHDPAEDENALFILDRIGNVSQTGTHFEAPPDFRLDDWLHGEFGLMAPSKGTRVLVEFDARAADSIRTRKVHPTQKLATAPDGRVRLSFLVPDTEPVKRWVLSWGGLAHVIEPAALRLATAVELQRALAKYGL